MVYESELDATVVLVGELYGTMVYDSKLDATVDSKIDGKLVY